jgi:hypothetical protein
MSSRKQKAPAALATGAQELPERDPGRGYFGMAIFPAAEPSSVLTHEIRIPVRSRSPTATFTGCVEDPSQRG